MSDFFAERLIDELFLTLAPQVAGRDKRRFERPGSSAEPVRPGKLRVGDPRQP